jgi:uncharacterized Ntn-hydrolase superfamily protein
MSLRKLLLPIIFFCLWIQVRSQDTFSIVAVDSLTGEIGSAGESCVGYSSSYPHGAAILSDVIPGIGAIHTQANYLPGNQQYAHDLMVAGLTPQQIIDSLVANDAGGNPKTRQYGIVAYNNGHPLSASYTGVNCQNFKNDTNNIYYSIQGNILLGQLVLDSMQYHFLHTTGTLADRLISTLQGAKMIGADTRCAVHNSSSLSSFLRVSRPGDPSDSLFCDLYMAYPQSFSGICPIDPIDSLQILYDQWKTVTAVAGKKPASALKAWSTSDHEIIFDFSRCADFEKNVIKLYDLMGRIILQTPVTRRIMTIHPAGTADQTLFFYQVLQNNSFLISSGKIVLK